jgi:hypothetical protein
VDRVSQLLSHRRPQTGLKQLTRYRTENAIAVFTCLGWVIECIFDPVDLCLGGVSDAMLAQIGNIVEPQNGTRYSVAQILRVQFRELKVFGSGVGTR